MKKIIPFIAAVMILCCGCGHVVTTYSKGVGVEFAWRPDTILPSVRLGSFENVDVAQKENTQVRYATNTGVSLDILGIGKLLSSMCGKANKEDAGSSSILEVKSGPMTTGYVADVLTNPNIKQEHVEIAKAMCNVENSLGDKETHVSLGGAETNVTPTVKTEKGILGSSTVTTPVNEYTQDAIKKQVSPNGIMDVIKSLGIYAVAGIVLIFLILAYVIVHLLQKSADMKEMIKNIKDLVK